MATRPIPHRRFDLAAEEALEFGVEPDGEDLADLLRMSPSARHLGEAELARPPRRRVFR